MSRNGQAGKILNNQKGFTLIELVIVIVILGILAVAAVPRYVEMRAEAANAAAEGVFGAAQAAAAINFAAGIIGQTQPAGGVIDSGTDLLAAMDGTPDGWTTNVGDTGIEASINSVTYTITVSPVETTAAKAGLTLTP